LFFFLAFFPLLFFPGWLFFCAPPPPHDVGTLCRVRPGRLHQLPLVLPHLFFDFIPLGMDSSPFPLNLFILFRDLRAIFSRSWLSSRDPGLTPLLISDLSFHLDGKFSSGSPPSRILDDLAFPRSLAPLGFYCAPPVAIPQDFPPPGGPLLSRFLPIFWHPALLVPQSLFNS